MQKDAFDPKVKKEITFDLFILFDNDNTSPNIPTASIQTPIDMPSRNGLNNSFCLIDIIHVPPNTKTVPVIIQVI